MRSNPCRSVAAVVVTHNRKLLLRDCLNTLLAQTRVPDEIIVVDNHSTDGTLELLSGEFPQITVLALPENLGGAGGFHYGMKLAFEKRYQWFWLMDDDTLPEQDALGRLLAGCVGYGEEVGLVCSHVMWVDGSPHLMNIPQTSSYVHRNRTSGNSVVPFNQFIERNLVRINACSFVSVLVSRHAVEMLGYPIHEMFIWGDDLEYTERICDRFAGYYVINSRVYHSTLQNRGVDMLTAPNDQVWRFFFEIRNQIYIRRKKGLLSMSKYLLVDCPSLLGKSLRRSRNRVDAAKICIRGLVAGFFFNPKIETA